jgi:hypothetical protein
VPTTRRVAAVVVAALAVLLPLLGAAAPATARVATRAVLAPVSSTAAGQGAGDPRRHGRVADRTSRAVLRQSRGERTGQGTRAGVAHRTVRVPFQPAAPATCGAGPTGPPSAWSRVLAPRSHPRASRRTPVGAGRSPPASCGR